MIDRHPNDLVRAATATVDARFGSTLLVVRPDVLGPGGGGDVVVVGRDRVIDAAALDAAVARSGEPGAVLDPVRTAALTGDTSVLTDDRAPADQLITSPAG